MRMLPAAVQFTLWEKVIGGPRAARRLGVTVGEGCRIYSCDVASEHWLVSIGDGTTVSVGVKFLTHDGVGWLVDDARGRRYRYAPIVVGSGCFVGAHSILMPGVQLGDRVVVGAGSVVTRSVPAGSVVAGNPARVIARTDDLLERVAEWPAESDRSGSSYQERVDSIVMEAKPLPDGSGS